jgi:CheY-like chemotaxis protein
VNGTTTLIVDDNEGMRLLARTLVVENGGKVVAEAADGEAGVQSALEHQPELILMDHRMPGGDGIEATRRIKAAQPDALVVAWTTTEDPTTARRFFEAGATEFVLKHDVANLERLLHRFCD